MRAHAVVLSASAILQLCLGASLGDQAEQSGLTGGLSTEPKPILTPSPETDTRQHYGDYSPFRPEQRPPHNRCPLCDSSVYPYCGEKLLHDACCCTDPYVHQLPYQCMLADCRFLHANSCREHRLIANCCCNDDYRSLLKSFAKIQE